MRKIKTICGETLLVDDEDYEKVIKYRWAIKTDAKQKNRPRIVTYSKIKGFKSGVISNDGWYRGISYKKLILNLGGKPTLFKNDNHFDLRKKNIIVFDTRKEHTFMVNKIYKKKNPKFDINRVTEHAIVEKKLQRKEKTGINSIRSKSSQGRTGRTVKVRSKYIGVLHDKPRYEKRSEARHKRRFKNLDEPYPWYSIIKHNGKVYYLGSYTKEEYAALAYDKKALEIYGSDAAINFSDLTLNEITEKLNEIEAENAVTYFDYASKCQQGKFYTNIVKNSKFVGVSFDTKRNKWAATITYRYKSHYLGRYDTEEEAALAYDNKALELYGITARRNFSKLTPKDTIKKFERIKANAPIFQNNYLTKCQQGKIIKRENKSSQYTGVTFKKKQNKWVSKICYFYKHYYIGQYTTEEEAARAYDKKAQELFGEKAKLNFPQNDYHQQRNTAIK